MLALLLVAAASAATCPPPGFASAERFDLDAYVRAPWHIQQQMPISYLPEAYNRCVTATYRKFPRKTLFGYDLSVTNHAENAAGKALGPIDKICAKVVNATSGRFEVSPCFLPVALAGPYWVLAFDDEAGFAVVSGGPPTHDAPAGKEGCRTGTGTNDSGLWLFTRQRARDEGLVARMRGLARAKGFDVSVLRDIDQTGCADPAVVV